MIDYNEVKDHTLKDFEEQYYTIDALNNMNIDDLVALKCSVWDYKAKIESVLEFQRQIELEK